MPKPYKLPVIRNVPFRSKSSATPKTPCTRPSRYSPAMMVALDTVARVSRMPAYRRRIVERELSAWHPRHKAVPRHR
jgi:hypothetical protein